MPIYYGQPEHWKMVADKIDLIKPNCAPAEHRWKKNDKRPLDTIKELLDMKQAKKQGDQVQ